jgi:hypothetical protein
VQFGVNRCHALRFVGIGIHFVGHVEIIEACLQNKRLRQGQDMFRCLCRFDQQFMYLLPGRIVTYRDSGVQNKTVIGGRRIIVADLTAEDQRIGNRDFDVLDGAYSCHQQRLLGYVAYGIGNPNPVADFERPGVGKENTGHDVGYRRCGAERQKYPEEYGNPFEGR